MDYDAIVVGGGPAGLSAGTHLARTGFRVLLLDKEPFGGQMMKLEWIVNYPGTGERVAGTTLASEMIDQAIKSGVRMEQGEVVDIENYSACKSVACADGKVHTCSVVILAGGLIPKKLAVPGEETFQEKGMIHCAVCDGSLFSNQVVAVCGGGDAGIIEALYLAKYASKIFVIETASDLTAKPTLQERARAHPKIEIRCGEKAGEIVGDKFVTGLQVASATTGRKELLEVQGVLVRVGFVPATGNLKTVLPLDDLDYVVVNAQCETEVPGIIAAGDIRRGSPRRVASAVSDGTIAAMTAQRLLQEMKQEN
jgi:thioredoxin reductase (NADPH)